MQKLNVNEVLNVFLSITQSTRADGLTKRCGQEKRGIGIPVNYAIYTCRRFDKAVWSGKTWNRFDGSSKKMLKVMLKTSILLCLVLACVAETNDSSRAKCVIGYPQPLSKYFPNNSSCYGCVYCHVKEPKFSSYISCKKNCSSEAFAKYYLFHAKFKFKTLSFDGDLVNDPKITNDSDVAAKDSTNRARPTEVPEDHVSQSIFIAINVSLFIIGSASVCFLLWVCKRKKQQTTFDAIVVHRRRENHEDENYIRYTKDPTSSTRKSRIRASWPRAGRSENRYLLEQNREPDSDSRGDNTSFVNANREDNPDSNSAQYVFIQTFPAATTLSDVPTSETDSNHTDPIV